MSSRPYKRGHIKREIPQKVWVIERRKRAVLYDIAGFSRPHIGLMLHADPNLAVDENYEPTGKGTPGGYGWRNWVLGRKPVEGQSLHDAVRHDLHTYWKSEQTSNREHYEELLSRELARLDVAQRALWSRVKEGNDWAIDRLLAIMDRRMKLLGLEAPKRVETTSVVMHGVQPEVDAGYATAVLDGLRELAAGMSQPAVEVSPVEMEPVDVEVVDDDG